MTFNLFVFNAGEADERTFDPTLMSSWTVKNHRRLIHETLNHKIFFKNAQKETLHRSKRLI